jgi:NTE family protein
VSALLRGVGVSGQGREAQGAALASYLLFESGYTRELIALGEADVRSRRTEVLAFFGWPAAVAAAAAATATAAP